MWCIFCALYTVQYAHSTESPILYRYIPNDNAWCVQRGLRGLSCFLGGTTGDEMVQPSALGGDALRSSPARLPSHASAAREVNRVQQFRHKRPLQRQKELAPLQYMLTYAHVSAVLFSPQPPVTAAYSHHLKSIRPSHERRLALTVGLHIRRADSCTRIKTLQLKPAPLEHMGQHSNSRMCYATSVYMDALLKLYRRYGPLKVLVSSDSSSDMVAEMRAAGGAFRQVFQSSHWHYLDYPRDDFSYPEAAAQRKSGAQPFIEFISDKRQQARIGETAFADLVHLSHMQFFVGHLGSRFGKSAWALATARHNTFVPYISVDGHSPCCAIDENCSRALLAMRGMVDCLSFAHEHGCPNNHYWQEGATARWEGRCATPAERRRA